MKLLLHNFVSSKFLKGVSNGYPLKIVATQVDVKEQDFNADFVRKMMERLDWKAFRDAASSLGQEDLKNLPELPPEPSNWDADDNNFLKQVHHALLEVDVIEGHLECPETGRKFTIRNGIPNMLANEDEVA